MKLRNLLVAFALVALGLAAWLAVGNARASRREAEAERGWTTAFGSLEDLLRRHPKRRSNSTAKELEVLAASAAISIGLAPRERGSVPAVGSSREPKGVRAASDYISSELIKPDASIGSPSDDLARYLEECRSDLDAIESLLVTGPPEWAVDVSLPEELPSPNLLGQIRMQRILLARALASEHDGRREAAARSVDASWSLNESLRVRPEMISVLMATACSRLEVGVLRKLTSVDDVTWQARLKGLAYRSSLLDALALEVRPPSAARAFARWGSPASWLQRIGGLLERPQARVMWAEYSDVLRARLVEIHAAPLSDHLPEAATRDRWTAGRIAATIAMPNLDNAFLRADRLVVDAELTSKVLEARRLRREGGGRWPAAIPGVEASRFPGASWRYEASPDGGMSLAFSRELASPYGRNVEPLPLRFTSP